MKNCKTLVALFLALVMLCGLTAANAEAATYRFEAEYASITGSVPGFIGVFLGASNKCMLEAYEGLSNGFAVVNAYNEGNDDDIPEITFTITSDVEAEAQIFLAVGPGWTFDASFNRVYSDTDVATSYPLLLNGEALTTSATVSGADAAAVAIDDENSTLDPASYVVADFGTVTLKAGENVFTMKGTPASCFIDYLEIVTEANLTWEESHEMTYRVYDEDEMEYVEVNVK